MNKTRCVVAIRNEEGVDQKVQEMLHMGIKDFRINFARGNYEKNVELVELIRQMQYDVCIFVDLPGKKKRINRLSCKEIFFARGDVIELVKSESEVDGAISICGELFAEIKDGDMIHFGDNDVVGEAFLKGDCINVEVKKGGKVKSKSGLMVPKRYNPQADVYFEEKLLCEKLINHVEGFLLSFADTSSRTSKCKSLSTSKKIIAKIETAPGYSQILNIAKYADALMLARGDLSNFLEADIMNTDILLSIHDVCQENRIEFWVATNYFLSIARYGYFDEADKQILQSTLHLKPNFILINETYYSKDWRKICDCAMEAINGVY